ncbi:hypothetical protein CHH27_10555 [Labrenzia sp. VG12]|nr:hypothetical protein CHH27_10555 [Labrenzia sp. VG12]
MRVNTACHLGSYLLLRGTVRSISKGRRQAVFKRPVLGDTGDTAPQDELVWLANLLVQQRLPA